MPIEVSLKDLASGSTGLSAGAGHNAAEAAAVCLDFNDVDESVVIKISGCSKATVQLEWKRPSQNVKDSHGDLQDATKDGAVGLAALCAPILFNRRIVRQSHKGTGFDYYINDPTNLLFQDAWGYEISGCLKEPGSTVRSRVQSKKRQVERGRGNGNADCDARIFVMEFSAPLAKTAKA
jgi:hypothetical protein